MDFILDFCIVFFDGSAKNDVIMLKKRYYDTVTGDF
jgi:hypothetical protein